MGIFDKFKNIIGWEEPYNYEYDKAEADQKDPSHEEPVVIPEEVPVSPRRTRSSFFRGNMENTNNVIDMHGSAGTSELVVMYPRKFEEMPAMIEALRERKSIVVNLTTIEPDQAQRCVDFIAGATYAIDGKQERVADSIFLFTPSCVTLTSVNSVTDQEIPPVSPKNTKTVISPWTSDIWGNDASVRN
jgi:cell division inhibitor SepF